jgi:hypothetical protein
MTSTPSALQASTMSCALVHSASAGALPGVAAVEQQRAGAAGLDALDQGGQVGEAADLAVGLAALSKSR